MLTNSLGVQEMTSSNYYNQTVNHLFSNSSLNADRPIASKGEVNIRENHEKLSINTT